MWPIAFHVGQFIGGFLSPRVVEKVLSHSIQKHEFRPLYGLQPFATREQMWDSAEKWIPLTDDVLFLEFGVFEGYSTRHFSARYKSAGSRFYGFDSFEGLPENWEEKSKGHFSTRGSTPTIDDARVKFVKGWFQNSVPEFLKTLDVTQKHVLVHLDADLYSSTLYLLHTLSARLRRYYFVFDEFPGDETRALYNYLQASGAKVRFLARTGRSMQIFGEIDLGPEQAYEPRAMQVSAG